MDLFFLHRCFGFPFGVFGYENRELQKALERAEKEHLLPIIGLLFAGLYG